MDAIEFVKKFGIAAASDLWYRSFPLYENDICILNGIVCTLSGNFLFDLLDIKQIVDAFELVGSYGGISNAKDHVLTLAHIEEYDKMVELQKAINLVEQSQ